MAQTLLERICEKFHNGVKKHTGANIGFKETAIQHFFKGRPIKDFVLVRIRQLYGTKYNPNGYTDTQLLDLLEEEYDEKTLNNLMSKYK